MPSDDTGIHWLIAEQGQHVFHPGFAIEDGSFDSLEHMPFIVFFHLPIGESLGQRRRGTTGAACRLSLTN